MRFSKQAFSRFSILSALTLLAFPASAIAQDPIGSYAGASIQFDDLATDVPVAVEGSYSFADNFQLRATLGDGLAAAAVTASMTTGQWRFAAGPGLRYTERENTTEFVTPIALDPTTNENTGGERVSVTTEDNSTDFVGVAVVERALGEYGVVFGSVSFSDNVSGAIGAGVRF